ncbi:integral peroxisomal membrane peroxin-domain-containing protein [Rhizoctonia solani]|nr:integral peroxisomal membrane peroxin-domain-containing protein [Rhizoctonia solani]
MAGVSPPARVQPIISGNNPPVLLDFVSHVPAPVTRLLVEQAGTIKVLRRVAEIASWRSPKPSESWLLLGLWWLLCGSAYFGVRYLVPVIVILPSVWRHLKAQTWWPWRSSIQPPHEPVAASDVTVAATISDITVLRLLLPAFLFQQPPVVARSPIIEAIQTFHNNLPLRPLLRATAILYVPYLALTYFISLPVLFGLLGTIVLTARAPWVYILRTLVSESGWARWAWRRIWAFLTGQPVIVPGTGFSIQEKQVSLPPKLGKKSVTVAQSLQPSRLRFRFDILENQRWWVGIDWSATLLPNERTSWCSPPPHLAPLSPPITFTLPPPTSYVDKTLKIKRNAFWRWDDPEWTVMVKTSADSHPSRIQLQLPDPSSDTEGRLAKGLKRVGENLPESVSGSAYSRKTIDTGDDEEEHPPLSPLSFDKDLLTDPDGWIYADNKWEMPSPKGGLGKYTRYRVWTRCAVLVEDIEELEESELTSASPTSDKPTNSSLEAPTALIAPNPQLSSPQKGHKQTLSEGGASMGSWRVSSTGSSVSDRESTLTSRLKSVLEHRTGPKS